MEEVPSSNFERGICSIYKDTILDILHMMDRIGDVRLFLCVDQNFISLTLDQEFWWVTKKLRFNERFLQIGFGIVNTELRFTNDPLGLTFTVFSIFKNADKNDEKAYRVWKTGIFPAFLHLFSSNFEIYREAIFYSLETIFLWIENENFKYILDCMIGCGAAVSIFHLAVDSMLFLFQANTTLTDQKMSLCSHGPQVLTKLQTLELISLSPSIAFPKISVPSYENALVLNASLKVLSHCCGYRYPHGTEWSMMLERHGFIDFFLTTLRIFHKVLPSALLRNYPVLQSEAIGGAVRKALYASEALMIKIFALIMLSYCGKDRILSNRSREKPKDEKGWKVVLEKEKKFVLKCREMTDKNIIVLIVESMERHLYALKKKDSKDENEQTNKNKFKDEAIESKSDNAEIEEGEAKKKKRIRKKNHGKNIHNSLSRKIEVNDEDKKSKINKRNEDEEKVQRKKETETEAISTCLKLSNLTDYNLDRGDETSIEKFSVFKPRMEYPITADVAGVIKRFHFVKRGCEEKMLEYAAMLEMSSKGKLNMGKENIKNTSDCENSETVTPEDFRRFAEAPYIEKHPEESYFVMMYGIRGIADLSVCLFDYELDVISEESDRFLREEGDWFDKLQLKDTGRMQMTKKTRVGQKLPPEIKIVSNHFRDKNNYLATVLVDIFLYLRRIALRYPRLAYIQPISLPTMCFTIATAFPSLFQRDLYYKKPTFPKKGKYLSYNYPIVVLREPPLDAAAVEELLVHTKEHNLPVELRPYFLALQESVRTGDFLREIAHRDLGYFFGTTYDNSMRIVK